MKQQLQQKLCGEVLSNKKCEGKIAASVKIMKVQKMQWLLNHLSHNWKKIILLRFKWTIECARLDTFNQSAVIGLQ